MTQWRRPLDFERFQHQPIFIHSIFHLVLCTVIPPRLAPASGHLCLTEKVAGRHFVTDSVAQEARFSSGFLDDVRFGGAIVPRGSSVTPEVALTSTGACLSTGLVVSEFKKRLLFCFVNNSDNKKGPWRNISNCDVQAALHYHDVWKEEPGAVLAGRAIIPPLVLSLAVCTCPPRERQVVAWKWKGWAHIEGDKWERGQWKVWGNLRDFGHHQ